MATVPQPLLTPIDLSRGTKHEHPDIETGADYLVQIGGRLLVGRFERHWYGWNFCWWPTGHVQFDAPGWNSSMWEAVWRIDRPPADDPAERNLPEVWEGMTVRQFATALDYDVHSLCEMVSVQAQFRLGPESQLWTDQAERLARCLDEEVAVVEPPEPL